MTEWSAGSRQTNLLFAGRCLLTMLCGVIGLAQHKDADIVLITTFGLLSLVTCAVLVPPLASLATEIAALVVGIAASHEVAEVFSLLLPSMAIAALEVPLAWKRSPLGLRIPLYSLAILPGLDSMLNGDNWMYGVVCLMSILVQALIVHGTSVAENAEKKLVTLDAKVAALELALVQSRNSERFSHQLGQLEERNEISQRLHDRVGHSLVASLISLEATSALLEKSSEPEAAQARDLLARTMLQLREGTQEIRGFLSALKPSSEDLGMKRLQVLLEAACTPNNLRLDITKSGDLDVIGPAQWSCCIECAREALTNTLRHAKAQTFSVKLEVLNKLVRLELRDDGKGATSIRPGIGLRGIEERCAAIGATVIADGSRGFSLVILMPREGSRP